VHTEAVSPAWSGRARPSRTRAAAVLFDRDGTLIHDVPYNGDPERVVPTPGAAEALDRLRHAGIRLGLVTNQSAVGRGLIDAVDVVACNAEVQRLLGPFHTVHTCPHVEQDACRCRKPAPGMVLDAAAALGVDPASCVVVGDIEGDLAAAAAAGARSILVPNEVTRPDEVERATLVARSLREAVDIILDGRA
jgi:D-glycero-D-manno-heptose 1,7-bisphosphate phosphatase